MNTNTSKNEYVIIVTRRYYCDREVVDLFTLYACLPKRFISQEVAQKYAKSRQIGKKSASRQFNEICDPSYTVSSISDLEEYLFDQLT